MLKKKSLLSLLFVLLFSVILVDAKEFLTEEKFKEKMEAMGYEVSSYSWSNGATATKGEGDDEVTVTYNWYEEVKDAKEEFAGICKIYKEQKEKLEEKASDDGLNYNISFSKVNCEKDTESSTGFISLTIKASKGDEEFDSYIYVYRLENTLIQGLSEDKSAVVDVMKGLGYYSFSTWIIFLVLGIFAFIIGAAVIIIVVISKKKKNNNMNGINGLYPNNGMNYNQNSVNNFNQPMNNGMNYEQNSVNNFNQPVDNNQFNNNYNNNYNNNN